MTDSPTTRAPGMMRPAAPSGATAPSGPAAPSGPSMFPHPDGEAALVLDEDQCWRLLEHTHHARLGLAVGGQPDIVPVNIAAHEGALYFRTAPGSKLAGLTVNPAVVVQADGILSDQAWSVIARGTARRLESSDEIAEAESLGIAPWVPSLKDFYVRVEVEQVSGRHFLFGSHPERDEEQTPPAQP